MKHRIASLLVVGLGLVTACKSYLDDNMGIDPTKAQVSVRMTAGSEIDRLGSSSGRISSVSSWGLTGIDTVYFDSVLLGVTKLKFERADTTGCGDGDKDDNEDENDTTSLEFEGAYKVNLITGISEPDFGFAQVSPGVFKKIEIKLGPVLNGGLSLLVKGALVTKTGDTIRFEFSSREQIKIKVRSAHGIALDQGSFNTLLVAFHLKRLHCIGGLAILRVGEDGILRIDDSTHPEIFHTLVLNLNEAVAWGHDENRDGDIDED